MILHFVNYHCHSHYSNILTPDSIVKVDDYVNRAKELGHKMLFCTQHGGTQGYFDMYNACKKNNIKFGYGAEAYWVKNRFEKDNTNNHIILIAKNNNGRKAINRVLSEANKTGFYYKPRIDLDLILSLPPNDVIITTACIGFYGYENYLEYIDILHNKFKDNFYLEIQPHLTESQINKNKELLEMSKLKGISLIAGLDSHYIYEKDFNDRKLFLYSKGIEYEQENGWYMDYCDYKTLFKRFKEQNIFSDEEINNAINATNIFLEFEDFYFDDKKIKLPTLYPDKTQEEKNKILKDILSKEIKNKFGTLSIPKEYSDAIKQEWDVVEKTDMADYFILNYHIIKRGIELGGKITLTSRGCFTKDAIVLTENNLKNINNIKIGDKVLTEDGRFNKVLNTFEYDVEEDMVEFEYDKQGSSYNKYKNICTLDHKILTKNGWKQAKDLKINDKLCFPKIKYDEKEIMYDLANYNFQNYEYDDKFIYEIRPVSTEYKYSPNWMDRNYGINHSWITKLLLNKNNKICKKKGIENYKKILEVTKFKTMENYKNYCLKHGFVINKIPRFIKMDYLWNMFVGMMYGDGWTHKNSGIGFAINNTTKKGINKYVFFKIAEKINMKVCISESNKKNLVQLFIFSKIIHNFFSTEFFKSKKGNSKIFNKNLLSQSKKNIKFLYNGLLKTDGGVQKKQNKINFDNTSLSLISAFKIMDNILGNPPLSFDVRLSHFDKRGYKNRESYKLRRSIFPKKNIIEEDDKYFYLNVKKIIYHKKIKTKVYDLQVDNFQSYTINNVVVHNSAPSFYICNLLGFTSIDRVNSPIQLFPERFATVDRIKAGSMFDIDFNLANRPAFIQAQKELLGENHSYFFSSYGKLKEKSAWKMFAKANDISFDISNNVTKYISEYENVKKHTEEEDLENIKVQDFIPKEYAEIYNGSLKYQGIVESISPAPCGFLLLQDDIDEEIGVIRVKEELCANIDGLVADKMLYMKNDLLLVTVVDYIYRTFEKIGIEPIVPNELINLSDSKVWDIFKNGQTVCINQCEQEKTKEKVMRYKPKNIQELSAFVAAIRPSFQSMINIFLDRESFSYNIPEFDKLIQTKEIPDSFIIYQEQIMKVLNYAGFEITECYTIMKNIAKKKVGTIEPIMDKFKKGFKEKTNTDNEHIEKVWQIIENSVSYCFNCSHALSVGLDALYGAYLKTYYPLEFYTSVIEIYTEKKDKDKISAIKQEMKLFGINEGDILFGLDNSKITYNKENNTIYPSLTSIKNMNEKTGLELLKLSNNKKYDNFLELIINIKSETTIKKNQLDILIKLDYFKQFGKSKKLIQFIEYFNLIYNAKSPSKEKIPIEIYDIVEKYSDATDKRFKINDNLSILEEIFNKLQNIDYTISEKISFQLEYLGYITYKNEDIPKEYVYIESIDTKYTPKVKVYCLNTGKSADVKIDKKFYNKNKVEKGDIICILSIKSEAKWIKDGDNFVQSTTEKEWKIHNYERKCL